MDLYNSYICVTHVFVKFMDLCNSWICVIYGFV